MKLIFSKLILLIVLILFAAPSQLFIESNLEAANKKKKKHKKKKKKKKKKKAKKKNKRKRRRRRKRYVRRKGYYKIRRGDSLRRIAKRLRIPYRVLLKMNRKSIRKGRLKVGARLVYFRKRRRRRRFYGRLYNGVQLLTGKGFRVRNSAKSWGTPSTIKLIKYVHGEMHKLYPNANPLLIGDISKKGGGPLGGHVSHQIGIDYDVSIYRKGNPRYTRMVTVTPATIDIKKNLDFIKLLYKTRMVQYIFLDYSLQKPLYEQAKREGWSSTMLSHVFQYPRRPGSRIGIIRHWRSHADHYHIRFSRRPIPVGTFTSSPEEMEDSEEGEEEFEENNEPYEDVTIRPNPLKSQALGRPMQGRLLSGVPIEDSSVCRLVYPEFAYTTLETKKILDSIFLEYKENFGQGKPWLIGKASSPGGGPIPGCIGHQNGLEIDIGFLRKGKQKDDFEDISPDELALKENWFLLQRLLATGRIKAVFMDYKLQGALYNYAKRTGVESARLRKYFQYPMGPDSDNGIIRAMPNRKSYFQVRFKPILIKK